MSKQHMSIEATPDQIRYANLLFWGAWLGIVVLIITFLMYVFGVTTPHVPVEQVVANWHLGVGEYVQATNSPTGWHWVALLGTGDFMNFAGVAWLAVLTIICYFTLIPGYLKAKDYIFVFIVIAEIITLSLAASGLLGAGGH